MSLIKCPECGRSISDKARQCPGCGWKVNLNALEPSNDFLPSEDKDFTNNSSNDYMQKKVEKIPALMEDSFNSKQVDNEKNIGIKDIKYKKSDFLNKTIITLGIIALAMLWSIWLANITANSVIKKFKNSIDVYSLEADSFSANENSIVEQATVANEDDIEIKEETTEDLIDNETQESESEKMEPLLNADNKKASLSFEYTGNEVKYGYVHLYIRITNNGDKPLYITSQKFHYINNISIEKSSSTLDTEIPAGRSSLLEIEFDVDKLKAAGIAAIDSFTYQFNTAENVDNEEYIPGDSTFTGLGIMY